MVKFLLAQVDGVYVAASVELLYKDVIYGWYGGMDREYGRYIPNELLVWHILSWGAENGYRIAVDGQTFLIHRSLPHSLNDPTSADLLARRGSTS